jgi:serine/threonine protein kinase
MAPETMHQSHEEVSTPAADAYSCAVIVWELLTGEVPFDPAQGLAIVLAVLRNQQRPTVPETFPSKLRTLLTHGWTQDPLQRASCSDMLSILDSLTTQESPPYRHLTPVRKRAFRTDSVNSIAVLNVYAYIDGDHANSFKRGFARIRHLIYWHGGA